MCVRSGVVHIYQHTLNGKSSKPVKPKSTIQVVSDTGQKSEAIAPIAIVGAFFRDEETLCIGYGNQITVTFEDIVITSQKKLQCLLRKDPRTQPSAKTSDLKTKTPIVSNDVHYVTPHSTVETPKKRKGDQTLEVPMEQRLENLTLNKLEGKVPKGDNVAQLLIQGLHSKDKHILRTVLSKREESIIVNTIKRLPMPVIVPLMKELTNLVQAKTIMSETSALWLHQLIRIHSGLLISNPDLPTLVTPALGSIESRIALQTPLNRLKGRVDLLLSQISPASKQDNGDIEEALLVFNDKDTSDSESEKLDAEFHSESDNEWNEESEEEEGMEEDEDNKEDSLKMQNGASESDEEMSS